MFYTYDFILLLNDLSSRYLKIKKKNRSDGKINVYAIISPSFNGMHPRHIDGMTISLLQNITSSKTVFTKKLETRKSSNDTYYRMKET